MSWKSRTHNPLNFEPFFEFFSFNRRICCYFLDYSEQTKFHIQRSYIKSMNFSYTDLYVNSYIYKPFLFGCRHLHCRFSLNYFVWIWFLDVRFVIFRYEVWIYSFSQLSARITICNNKSSYRWFLEPYAYFYTGTCVWCLWICFVLVFLAPFILALKQFWLLLFIYLFFLRLCGRCLCTQQSINCRLINAFKCVFL